MNEEERGQRTGWGNPPLRMLLSTILLMTGIVIIAWLILSPLIELEQAFWEKLEERTVCECCDCDPSSYDSGVAEKIIPIVPMELPRTIEAKNWVRPGPIAVPSIMLHSPTPTRIPVQRKRESAIIGENDVAADRRTPFVSIIYESIFGDSFSWHPWHPNCMLLDWGGFGSGGGSHQHPVEAVPIVPEPSTFILGSIGLIMLAATRTTRGKK